MKVNHVLLRRVTVMGGTMNFSSSILMSVWLLLVVSSTSFAVKPLKFTRDEGGRILLPVSYSDGQTFHYMLGTNTRRLGIRESSRRIEGIKVYPRRTMRSFSPLGLLNLPLASVDNVSFDGRVLKDKFGGVYPANSSAAGLLGYDAFGAHIVYIQPESSTVTFLANSATFSNDQWQLLAGRPNRHGGIVLEVEFQGVLLDVLLDTSLSRSVLDREAAKVLGIDPGRGGKNTRFIDVAIGVFPHMKTWPRTKIEGLSHAGWMIGDLEAGVSRLPVEEATGKKEANLLILGSDVLTSSDIALDFRDHQVWVPLKPNQ